MSRIMPMLRLNELLPADYSVKTFELLQTIFQAEPGFFIVSGEFGSGRLTILAAIAHELAQSERPIKILTEKEIFPFEIDANTSIQTIQILDEGGLPDDKDKDAWEEAINQSLEDESSILLVDSINPRNIDLLLAAASKKRWIFSCLDTPHVGIDIAYTLRRLKFSNSYHEILQSIVAIWSQILVPMPCEHCATTIRLDVEEMRAFDPGATQPENLKKEVGCDQCQQKGTYSWRAIYEIIQLDDETRPPLQAYLEQSQLISLDENKHIKIHDFARKLLRDGYLGVDSYRQFVSENPILRGQNLLDKEKYRALELQDMFSRFVTRQVAERVMQQSDFARIMEGEHRKATCLFCDVRNFTSYAEQFPPNQIFQVINQYLRDIIDIVFEHEGTIDKFIGDSIMIVFGTPFEQSDQEIRAIQCAIDIQKRVANLNQTISGLGPIRFGIGINTGDVIAGCLGSERRMDYTVLGDVVNVAARLESNARAGQILISPSTYSAVKDKIDCRSLGTLKLKGKSQLLETFEVIYCDDCEDV